MTMYVLTCPHNTAHVAKKEIQLMGYQPTILSPTTVIFQGDDEAIARCNIHSRIGNKLFIQLAHTTCETFDDVFTHVEKIDRGKYIPFNRRIRVTATSKQHMLTSIPAIQSLTKKAITQKCLEGSGETRRDEKEEAEEIHVHVALEKNMIMVLIDTTGASMHQRGYRQYTGAAPIKENLAAALVLLSGRKYSNPFVDPFCGAGTIAIEAAMIAKNIAPGIARAEKKGFAFQHFSRLSEELAQKEIEQAKTRIIENKEHTIIGYDNDPTMIAIAKDNAQQAGVAHAITFRQRDFLTERDLHSMTGTIVTNPPYGERMVSDDLHAIYQKLVSLYEDNGSINGGFITTIADTQDLIQPSYRKQTLYYNGALEARFFKIARL